VAIFPSRGQERLYVDAPTRAVVTTLLACLRVDAAFAPFTTAMPTLGVTCRMRQHTHYPPGLPFLVCAVMRTGVGDALITARSAVHHQHFPVRWRAYADASTAYFLPAHGALPLPSRNTTTTGALQPAMGRFTMTVPTLQNLGIFWLLAHSSTAVTRHTLFCGLLRRAFAGCLPALPRVTNGCGALPFSAHRHATTPAGASGTDFFTRRHDVDAYTVRITSL